MNCQMLNHRIDHTQYPARGQELPAIYTNGPWYHLMTYSGNRPFTGGSLSQIPAKGYPSFPWTGWVASENWAALVNDQNEGLGIWETGTYNFIGGFAGKPGEGGPKDSPTGYIAPTSQEILDHNIDFTYSYALIAGSVDEIRSYVYQHSGRAHPPDYLFSNSRLSWKYAGAKDTGWPIKGELNILPQQADPEIIGPTGLWKAESGAKLILTAAFDTGVNHATIYWKRFDANSFNKNMSIVFPVISNGKYHTYKVPLSASREYRGMITGLRLDTPTDGKLGKSVRIKEIAIRK